MTKTMPPWPAGVPRLFSDRATVHPHPWHRMPPLARRNAYAEYQARRRRELQDSIRATGLTQGYNEAFFSNTADHTAVASTSAEASLLAGTNRQPVIPAGHFLKQGAAGTGITLLARGVFSTTSTPTLIFQVRLGDTAGSTFLSGTSLGVSAAVTTGSGVTNKWWELRMDLCCRVPGIGTGNATLAGSGYVQSPGGFASPFNYALEPTTPDTATWTSTFNAALTQYFNVSATWSASSASNTITCKELYAFAW